MSALKEKKTQCSRHIPALSSKDTNIMSYHQFMTVALIWLLTEFDSFPWFDITNSWPFPWLNLLLNLTLLIKVSMGHVQRVWHADRGRLLLRTPGPVPLGLAYVLLVETNSFPNLSLFYRTMLFEYPSVLSRFCFRYLKRVPTHTPQFSLELSFSLWTIDMLDFISMGFAELCKTVRERNIQNRNICLQRDLNKQPSTPFQGKPAPKTNRLRWLR